MVIVVASRVAGQPIHSAIDMNRKRSDRPVMISGITSGAVIMPASSSRPRNRVSRCMASATSAPRQVATVALTAAIRRLRSAASSTSSSSSRCAYHRREKPPTASPASSR